MLWKLWKRTLKKQYLFVENRFFSGLMTDFIFAYITIFQLLFSETAHGLPGATEIEDLDMPSGHSPDPI